MKLRTISILVFTGMLLCEVFSGRVTDKDNSEPLINANVVVVGEGKGASTDLEGNFFIPNLNEGIHTLQISMVGYETVKKQIEIPKETYHQFSLKPDVKSFQPVIVTANRQKQNLQESPVTITVVNAEEIKSQAAQRMDDVMRTAPGITMNRSSVSLRNCSGFTYGVGSRVLIMIDGIPMLSGDTGEPKWDAIDAGSVKQVEIVKNSGSALYGSNAMGGVINVITQDPPDGMHYKIDLDMGVWDKPYFEEWRWSDKTRIFNNISVGNTYKNGPIATFLTATTKMDDSYREIDDSKRFGIVGKLKYADNAKSDFLIHMNMAYEDRGQNLDWLNTEHALEVDPNTLGDRVYSSKLSLAGLYNLRDIEKKKFITSKVYTFMTHFTSKEYDQDNPYKLKRRFATSSKTGLDGQISFAGTEHHRLTTGAEASMATVNSTLFSTRSGFGGAAYVQDELTHFHPLVFSVGGRFDFFTVQDAKTYYQFNPKAGLVYHLAENIALRSSVGSGYRVPTLAELFTEMKVAGLIEISPNPDLDAEKSYSAEIGGNIITRTTSFDVALFSNWYSDMIEPLLEEGSSSQARFINITKARVMGTELTATWNKDPLSFTANYLYTSSIDVESDRPLPYRPDHSVTLRGQVKYLRDIASVNAAWRYKSKRLFSLYPEAPSVPEKILDLGHSVTLGRYYVNIKVNNVFQYHYSEAEKGIEDIRNYVFSVGMSI